MVGKNNITPFLDFIFDYSHDKTRSPAHAQATVIDYVEVVGEDKFLSEADDFIKGITLVNQDHHQWNVIDAIFFAIESSQDAGFRAKAIGLILEWLEPMAQPIAAGKTPEESVQLFSIIQRYEHVQDAALFVHAVRLTTNPAQLEKAETIWNRAIDNLNAVHRTSVKKIFEQLREATETETIAQGQTRVRYLPTFVFAKEKELNEKDKGPDYKWTQEDLDSEGGDLPRRGGPTGSIPPGGKAQFH